MKRLTFALGLLVALTAAHQPLVAKLFQADPDKLCEYAYKGQLKKVKEAIVKGADVNAEGMWTRRGLSRTRRYRGTSGTPLYAAIEGDRIEVAKYLLGSGAQVNVPDVRGFTPLHQVVLHGSLDMAQLLITKGADLDAQNVQRSTPLHIAVQRVISVGSSIVGNKMAQLLVTSGANPYIKNKDGQYPYQLARGRRFIGKSVALRVIAKTLDPENRHEKAEATRKAARKEKRVEFFRKIIVRD